MGGADGRAERVTPVENALHSPVAYAMQPQAQVEAMMAFERDGLELLAIFHSHPGGPAVPSQTDVRQAYYPDSLYLIFSPDAAGGGTGGRFRLTRGAWQRRSW